LKYLILLPLLLLLSCQNQDNPSVEADDDDDVTMPAAPGAVAFEVFKFADSALLVETYRYSPQAIFKVNTLVPKSDNEKLNTLINTALAKVIAGEEAPISVTNLPQTIKIAARTVLYNYKKQDVDTADLEDMWTDYTLDNHYHTEVLLNSNNLVSLVTNHYFYSGSTRGNHYNVLHTFTTDSVQQLAFNDIFLPDQEAELVTLLTLKAESLGIAHEAETVSVTENIAFTKRGLRFDYPPYEASFNADGEIEILVPYAEVSHLLTGRAERLALGIIK